MSDPRATDQVVATDLAAVHLAAIRKRWWLPVTGLLLVGLLAYLVAASGQKRYDASASVLLTNVEPITVASGLTVPINPDQERALNTEVALVKLESTADTVKRRLGLDVSATQLLSEISVTPQGTTNLLEVTARDADPGQAARIANAFAAQYLTVRRDLAQSAFRQAADQTQAQLDALTTEQQAGVRGQSLRHLLHRLEITGEAQTGEAQLVDRATLPTTPATPRPRFPAAVGALLGALLGALAAVAWGAADRRASSRPVDADGSWRSRLPAWTGTSDDGVEPPSEDELAPTPLPGWQPVAAVSVEHADGNGHGQVVIPVHDDAGAAEVEGDLVREPTTAAVVGWEKSKRRK
jgi:uncharacterized protein involved in exopolysaccharide biosynthesis